MAQVKVKIKKGDQVVVLAGGDKGKQGEVLVVKPKDNKAIVEGINVIKRHTKPSAQNPQGGIVETEAPIHISNLAIVDPESGKPTKVKYDTDDNGKKIRVAKKSGKTL